MNPNGPRFQARETTRQERILVRRPDKAVVFDVTQSNLAVAACADIETAIVFADALNARMMS
jgi:hypothetical protein